MRRVCKLARHIWRRYWLYAAIAAGEDGLLVSNDEMRDHTFQLLAPRRVGWGRYATVVRKSFLACWHARVPGLP